jgi:CRISPR-associated protein Csm2
MTINLAAFPPDAELFNTDAEAVARRLGQAAGHLNKPTQIRRFYDELVGWQERIDGDDEKFRQYEAFIKMLNAKVAYAKGRKLVDDQFVDVVPPLHQDHHQCQGAGPLPPSLRSRPRLPQGAATAD